MTCFPSVARFGRRRARGCWAIRANRTTSWIAVWVKIRTLVKSASATSTSPKLTGEKTWGALEGNEKTSVDWFSRVPPAYARVGRRDHRYEPKGEKILCTWVVDKRKTHLGGHIRGRGRSGVGPLRVEGERLFTRRRRVGAGDASRRLRRLGVRRARVESRGSTEQVHRRQLAEGHLGGDAAVGRGRPRRSVPASRLGNECKPESKGWSQARGPSAIGACVPFASLSSRSLVTPRERRERGSVSKISGRRAVARASVGSARRGAIDAGFFIPSVVAENERGNGGDAGDFAPTTLNNESRTSKQSHNCANWFHNAIALLQSRVSTNRHRPISSLPAQNSQSASTLPRTSRDIFLIIPRGQAWCQQASGLISSHRVFFCEGDLDA